MTKKIILSLCAYYISFFANGQDLQWAKHIGSINDAGTVSASKNAIDKQGNIYIIGSYQDTVDFDPGSGVTQAIGEGINNSDIYVTKFDNAGNFVWVKSIGSIDNEYASNICIDKSGNVIIVGTYENGLTDFDPNVGAFNLPTPIALTHNLFILKLSNSGNFIFAKSFNSMSAFQNNAFSQIDNVKVDSNNNIYSYGFISVQTDFDPSSNNNLISSNGYLNAFLSKLDSNGNFVWAFDIPTFGTAYSVGECLEIDEQNNIIISGTFNGVIDIDPSSIVNNITAIGDNDIFIAKFNTSGNLVFSKQIGTSGTLNSTGGLATDTALNIYFSGDLMGTVDMNPGAGVFNLSSPSNISNTFIEKLDVNGNFLWAKLFENDQSSGNAGLAVSEKGNSYVISHYYGKIDLDPGSLVIQDSSNGTIDFFISNLDSAGNYVWGKSFGGNFYDYAHGVVVDKNNRMYISGYFANKVDFNPDSSVILDGGQTFDMYIMKYGTCNVPNVIITSDGNTLTANIPNVIYSWFNCETNTLVPGATSQSFTPVSSGSYKVEIDIDGCKTMSSCKNISIFPQSIFAINNNLKFSIFPNPANVYLEVICDNFLEDIKIYNNLGVLVQREKASRFSVANLSAGIYWIKVNTQSGAGISKFIKYQ